MDMYQKRKMRQENNSIEKDLPKTSINCLITIYRNSFEKAHK